MICAGDRLQSGSGVFRIAVGWPRLNVGPVFDVRRRFAVFTVTSALPLD